MRNCAQIGIDDEIFVDSFAGGGGASTGMEVGLGITVAAAINHDPAAILMHKTNHPYTERIIRRPFGMLTRVTYAAGVLWAARGSRQTASISARPRARLSLIRKSVVLRGSR